MRTNYNSKFFHAAYNTKAYMLSQMWFTHSWARINLSLYLGYWGGAVEKVQIVVDLSIHFHSQLF